MHLRKTALAALAAAIALGGCESMREVTGNLDKDQGQIAGAGAGAAAAAMFTGWGTLGIVLASIAGGVLGDDLAADATTEQALAKGEPATLRGQKTGKAVDVRTVRTYQSNGRNCRDYVIDPEGPAQGQRATVCEGQPGQWQIVQGPPSAGQQASQQGTPAIAPSQQLVRRVQEQLKAEGMHAGPADGNWGTQTQQAVRQFQQARGLDATGQLDMRTLQALGISGEPAGAGGTGMQK